MHVETARRERNGFELLTPEQIARFWSKIARRGEEACWIWRGARGGHWQPFRGGYSFSAKRLAALLTGAPVPTFDLHMLPTCGTSDCINPRHLRSTMRERFDALVRKTDACWLWEIDRPHRSEYHPTMKPVELFARAIRNSSTRGDLVLDPFVGSGTAIVACEETARVCCALDIDPACCAVAIQRWVDQTGEKPKRLD